MIEGKHLLEESLKGGFDPIKILATKGWLEKNINLLTRFDDSKIYEIPLFILEYISSTVNPDGVLALLDKTYLPSKIIKNKFILVLDRIQDPGNIGTLFRTALAAEVDYITLLSGANPLSPKVLRSSSGAVLHLPYERLIFEEKSSEEIFFENLGNLIVQGFQIVGTFSNQNTFDKDIKPYWRIDWLKPTLLILGNEGSGINYKISQYCTHLVTLPHSSLVESLNVASAAVPLLLERTRTNMVLKYSEKH